MATYEVGQTLTFGLKTYTEAGVLADVGTGPTATVTKPDSTTASASVSKTATGTYAATYTASAAGRWKIVWSGSGANSGGLPYTDVADVLDMSRLIISLGDARAALNVASASTVNDDELRGFIAAATVVIEHITGPILGATKVETRSGNGRAGILLHNEPTTITTVTEDGVTLTAGSGYVYDEAGVLWRGSRAGGGNWSTTSPRNVVVTYTVGSSTVPANVIAAARWLVAHWWRNGQQSWRPPYAGADLDMAGMTPVLGYAIPNAVVDMLAPSISPVRRAAFA